MGWGSIGWVGDLQVGRGDVWLSPFFCCGIEWAEGSHCAFPSAGKGVGIAGGAARVIGRSPNRWGNPRGSPARSTTRPSAPPAPVPTLVPVGPDRMSGAACARADPLPHRSDGLFPCCEEGTFPFVFFYRPWYALDWHANTETHKQAQTHSHINTRPDLAVGPKGGLHARV